MRQIKFRAWDKKTSTIREVAELKFDGAHYNVRLIFPTECAPRNWHLRMFDEIELMQFTGLHDRNGVDIYEGDVIKTDLCHPTWVDCLYKVVFQDGAFQMKTKSQKGSLAFAYHIHQAIVNDAIESESEYEKHLEVIGNIYEHPNLLTNE